MAPNEYAPGALCVGKFFALCVGYALCTGSPIADPEP